MDLSAGGTDLGLYLPGLLAEAGVTGVHVATFHKEHSFHGDTSTEAVKEITSTARAEHLERHFGFWEYVLRAAIDTDSATRRQLLEAALRHTSGNDGLEQLSTVDFTANLRGGMYDDLDDRTIVSLTSIVQTSTPTHGSDQQWHLPMLDLGSRIGPKGQQSALEALEALGLRGLIFESGRSYHFFGSQPRREAELWKLLGRAQLLSPIVDARWISHQMIDGRCGLRISTDRERHTSPHRYVARLDPPAHV